MGAREYSTTAASNLTVGGVSIAEGMSRASVNNALRAGYADIADLLLDLGGATTTTGALDAYLLSLDSAPAALGDNLFFLATSNVTNTGAATMNINSLGAVPIEKMVTGTAVPITADDFPAGHVGAFVYSTANASVILLNPGTTTLAGGGIALYEVNADAEAALVPGSVNVIQTLSYDTAGDGGGATYKRVGSEPTHLGKLQSADGDWWEYFTDGPVNVLSWGAKPDGATDNSAIVQSIIDTGFHSIYFPAGTYRLSGILLPRGIRGYQVYGDGRRDSTTAGELGTVLVNNNTTPMFRNSGEGSSAYWHFHDLSMTQTGITSGHIFQLVTGVDGNTGALTNSDFERITFVLQNPASSFFSAVFNIGIGTTIGQVRFKSIKGNLAQVMTVPGIHIRAFHFGLKFEDVQIDGTDNPGHTVWATTYFVWIQSTINSECSLRIDGMLLEISAGGALYLDGVTYAVIQGLATADNSVFSSASQVALRSTTGTCRDITFIGCNLQGTASFADLDIVGATNVTVIGGRCSRITSETFPVTLIGNQFTPTLHTVNSKVLEIGSNARTRGWNSFGKTMVVSRNIGGTATLLGASGSVSVPITTEDDTNYDVFVSNRTAVAESFRVADADKTTTSFVIKSSNTSSTAVVTWFLVRLR